MNERQAATGSDGGEPPAARTPDEDKGFELPPPPAPGALWASPSSPPGSAPVSGGAGRATVPGAMNIDPAGLRAMTWPTGGSKIYGGPTEKVGDAAQTSRPARSDPDRPDPTGPEPHRPEPNHPEPDQPEPREPEPEHPRPSRPRPGEPSKPAEPFKPFDPPAPVEPPPSPVPTPTPGPGPSPAPPAPAPPAPGPRPGPDPGPVPPGPGPSPIPPGPDPSPIPPGPGPSPVPPGPGPSPVPGPPPPIFPPPPIIPSAAGLPAYTMPRVGPQPPTDRAPSYEHRQHPQSEQQMVGNPTPSWNQPSGSPSGVGSPGAVRQPFGGPAAQVSTPPAHYATYGQSSPGLPQQRGEGTVYGAQNPADMTMPVTMNAIDNSGSLTGHILAQGWDRGEDTGRRSNVKVAIAMLAVLLFLVGVSLLFLFTAGDAFTDMIDGVFNKQ